MNADVKIVALRPQRHRHAIFVSAGDRETFASLALETLSAHFDILIFCYGKSARQDFARDAAFFAVGAGAKFNALKEIHAQVPNLIARYRTVWVCDDDIRPEFGDVRLLPAACLDFGLKVLSPAHSRKGRISYDFMTPRIGTHLLRYVTFAEMTCPLFETGALIQFLEAFDGSLFGWAEDWWYLNIFGADREKCAAIVDAVSIVNPDESGKQGGYREIELLGALKVHIERWRNAKKTHGLKEWPKRVLGVVRARHIPPDCETAKYRKPDLKARLSMLACEINYILHFYRLRRRLNRLLFASG